MKNALKTAAAFCVLSSLSHAMNPYDFNCMGCHGENGERPALGKSKPIAGMDKAELLEKMRSYRNGKLNTYGFGGLMRQQLFKVKEDEYEKIADYISNLKAEKK